MGPRYLAVVDFDGIPDTGAGLAALNRTITQPSPPLDAITESLELVRARVRAGGTEAPELLGLLRDALRRHYVGTGPDGVPPELESKVLTLNAILSRERRDIRGVATGDAGLRRINQLLPRANSAARSSIISDGLQLSQELAELYDGLGAHRQARDVLLDMRQRLIRLGDPERNAEPGGWLQQQLLVTAAVHRHLARTGDEHWWLCSAADAADRAVELALGPTPLPSSWAIAAGTQRVAVTLDRAVAAARPHPARAERLLTDAQNRLRELDRQCRLLPDTGARAHSSALLGVRLITWRAALLHRNPVEIAQAQGLTLRDAGARLLPRDRARIVRYQRAGVGFGVPINAGALAGLRGTKP
jgi:hypothetical protein